MLFGEEGYICMYKYITRHTENKKKKGESFLLLKWNASNVCQQIYVSFVHTYIK
jgi:hypothetical protein